jgi:hypothetical protein
LGFSQLFLIPILVCSQTNTTVIELSPIHPLCAISNFISTNNRTKHSSTPYYRILELFSLSQLIYLLNIPVNLCLQSINEFNQ